MLSFPLLKHGSLSNLIHAAICLPTLRLVYLCRKNEDMSSCDCLVLIFHYFDCFLEKLGRQIILG